MFKFVGAFLTLAFLTAPLAAGGRFYHYQYGRYYPPRSGPYFYHYPGYRYGGYYTGYRYGYSPSFSLGVYRPSAYFGFDSCDVGPYYGGAIRARGSYPVVLSLPVSSEVVRANFSDMIFNVSPSRALVYVDGKLIGSARGFATERDRYMILQGEHELRIEHHGYEAFAATLDVTPNRTLRIDVELVPLAEDSR